MKTTCTIIKGQYSVHFWTSTLRSNVKRAISRNSCMTSLMDSKNSRSSVKFDQRMRMCA